MAFQFDPIEIWESPFSVKTKDDRDNGIAFVTCPNCGALRPFVVSPDQSAKTK